MRENYIVCDLCDIKVEIIHASYWQRAKCTIYGSTYCFDLCPDCQPHKRKTFIQKLVSKVKPKKEKAQP